MSDTSELNQTLYVNNLNDKINKNDLRESLYMLFSLYGSVIDIVALKTSKMRGQAFIVFADVQSAVAALRSLHGTVFLGKAMSIQYAKSKSNAVAMLDGTFRIPEPASASLENPATAGTKRTLDEAQA